MRSQTAGQDDWWSCTLSPEGAVAVRADMTGVEGHDRVFSLSSGRDPWTDPVLWVPAELVRSYWMSPQGPRLPPAADPEGEERSPRESSGRVPLWDVTLRSGALMRVRADLAQRHARWWRFRRVHAGSAGGVEDVVTVRTAYVRSVTTASTHSAAFAEAHPGVHVLEVLQEAMDRRDRLLLADAVDVALRRGVGLVHVWVLSALLASSWHDEHRRLATLVGQLPGAATADVLLGIVRSYTSPSGFSDVARCTLRAAIATLGALPDAHSRSALTNLTTSREQFVRDEAREALSLRRE